MATPTHDKYYLRTLHQEIDLFDRKLAHLLKYDTFATEGERTVSATKMRAKRELLVVTARQLVSEGIEFKPSELPRSLRTDAEQAEQDNTPTATPTDTAAPEPLPRPNSMARQFASPFAGGVLDGQTIMQTYKRTRTKTPVAQA